MIDEFIGIVVTTPTEDVLTSHPSLSLRSFQIGHAYNFAGVGVHARPHNGSTEAIFEKCHTFSMCHVHFSVQFADVDLVSSRIAREPEQRVVAVDRARVIGKGVRELLLAPVKHYQFVKFA